ncbi:hypothetical protein PTKIN_Ptkin19aG0040900 [Pterospermum kingtungense]
MDRFTASCKRLAYAKVCIEIGIDQEIPNTVKVIMKDGSISHVLVHVPWYPQKCNTCKVFGHNDKTCSKAESKTAAAPKQVWVAKQHAIESEGNVGSSVTFDIIREDIIVSKTCAPINGTTKVMQDSTAKQVQSMAAVLNQIVEGKMAQLQSDLATPSVKEKK